MPSAKFISVVNLIPSRFYGPQFQQSVKMWRHAAADAAHVPFNIAKEKIVSYEQIWQWL